MPAAAPPVVGAANRSSEWRWLAAILIAAVALRLWHIGDACFWLDEFFSMENSTGRGVAHALLPQNVLLNNPPVLTTLDGAPPWWRIWSSLDLDSQPPLYFVLLRFWRTIAGDSESAVRTLAALTSAAAVALFYPAARSRLPARAALWATALMAVSSPQIHYAQETRGYAQWQFLTVAGALLILRIETHGPTVRRVILLGLTALALPLTHYFSVATVAAFGLYALWRFRGQHLTRTVTTLTLAMLAFALVWGPFLWRQRNYFDSNNAWQTDPYPNHLTLTAARAAALPLRWLTEAPFADMPVTLLPWTGLACAIVTAALLFLARRQPALQLWSLHAILLVALVTTVDLIRYGRCLDVSRYTFTASPAIFIALAAMTARFRQHWSHLIPATALAICLATLRGAYSDAQEWRAAAEWLRHNARPGDVIVYASGSKEAWRAGSLYLGISHYAPNLPAQTLLLTTRTGPAIESALRPGRSTWLLCASDEDPTVTLPGCRVVQSALTFARISEVTAAPATTPPARDDPAR